MELLHVYWSHLPITKNGDVRFSDSNMVIFRNVGTVPVMIESNNPLLPGEGFTYPGFPGEVLEQGFHIQFQDDTLNGCKLLAIVKEYRNG